MTDFNQSQNQTGEQFGEYPTMPIDLNTFIAQKIAKKQEEEKKNELGGFDPHKMMVNKFKIEKGDSDVELPPIVEWPPEEMKALEDFCQKHGILGFNPGRMSPIAALSMLKNKLGMGDLPLEERIPYGYQKVGGEKKVLHG